MARRFRLERDGYVPRAVVRAAQPSQAAPRATALQTAIASTPDDQRCFNRAGLAEEDDMPPHSAF